MSITDRYKNTFMGSVNSEEDYEMLKDAIYLWVRSLNNPKDWPVCSFGRADPKSAYFYVESNTPLEPNILDMVKKIYLENNCSVFSTLLIPPHPAS